MITSAVLYHVLHFFHITIDIRNVCVFLAPLFSSFTAIVTYHFTKELKVKHIITCLRKTMLCEVISCHMQDFFLGDFSTFQYGLIVGGAGGGVSEMQVEKLVCELTLI